MQVYTFNLCILNLKNVISMISMHVESDEYIFPECGDVFRIVGYKVTLMEHLAWRQMHSSQKNKEVVIETQEPMTIENKEVSETPNSVAETQEPTTQDSTIPRKYGDVMV